MQRAAANAAALGHCHREVPVAMVVDGVLVEGVADLAFASADGWVVVDFKTDIEIASAQEAYSQQVAMYVETVQRATGQRAQGVLLKV